MTDKLTEKNVDDYIDLIFADAKKGEEELAAQPVMEIDDYQDDWEEECDVDQQVEEIIEANNDSWASEQVELDEMGYNLYH